MRNRTASRVFLFAALAAGVTLGAAACSKNRTSPQPGGGVSSEEPAAAGAAAAAPEREAASGKPVVELETSMGRIRIGLYTDKAPRSVENFVQYVREGFYSGTIFHRVIDGFMIQGGGFDESMEKKETRAPIMNEADNGLKNERGTIAMARTPDPHSATAQFFVNVSDNAALDHRGKTPEGWGYAVFGRVVAGMDVVDRIKSVQTGPKGPFTRDAPQTDVVIKDARVL